MRRLYALDTNGDEGTRADVEAKHACMGERHALHKTRLISY
jgi:hypothetical protein